MIIDKSFYGLNESYEDVATAAKRIVNALVEEIEDNGMTLTSRGKTFNLNFMKSEGSADTAFRAFKSEVQERLWRKLPEASNYLDMIEPIVKGGWDFLNAEISEAKESGEYLSGVENGLPDEVEVQEGDIVDFDYKYGTDYSQVPSLDESEIREIIEDHFDAEIRSIRSVRKKGKGYVVSGIEWNVGDGDSPEDEELIFY